ncbi:MAG: hypothetical protein WCV50_05185 [Patescibacteria group bacterium]|jgi:hypothetical protein
MKKIIVVFIVVVASTMLTAGIVRAAASHNITSALGGVAGDSFSLDGTLATSSLRVGSQGTGGVTYFNGTIVNTTTGTGGTDNPVTFGDNVRVDGRVYRGATAGTADSLPFIVNDNMEVAGTLTIGGKDATTKTVLSGSLDLTAAGDETIEYDYSADCIAEYPEGVAKYTYHYRKILVPDLSVDNPMELRVFTSVDATSGQLDLENQWVSAGYTMTDGAIYVYFKSETQLCGGSSTVGYGTTGDYKVVIVD